jgi:hypothetical protein
MCMDVNTKIPSVAEMGGDCVVNAVHMLFFKLLGLLLV